MGDIKTYKDLEVWIKSRILVKEIYIVSSRFPKEELYGLASQIRRSAVSIPSNIAEGCGRQYKNETLQFLHIARGSIYELETQIYIASDLGYVVQEKISQLVLMIDECKKLLNGLIKYLENNKLLK